MVTTTNVKSYDNEAKQMFFLTDDEFLDIKQE